MTHIKYISFGMKKKNMFYSTPQCLYQIDKSLSSLLNLACPSPALLSPSPLALAMVPNVPRKFFFVPLGEVG